MYTHREAHVSYGREGDAMHIRCEACGATETVADYEHGEASRHFIFKLSDAYGWARVKCFGCGEDAEWRRPFSD